METTGEIVKRLCQEQGLTREKFARLAGISEGSVWRIIHNADNITIKTLNKVAKALGVRIDYIFVQDEVNFDGMSAGERIKSAYKHKYTTLEEFAKKIDVFPKTITKAMNDIFSVRHNTLVTIAEGLGLDAEELYEAEMERIRNAGLNEKVNMLLRRKGITRKEFCKRLGIDIKTLKYQLYEKRKQIGIETFKRWAEVLDVPVEIFYDEKALIEEALSEKTLGARLGKLLEVKGMTQRQLSKKSGLCCSLISSIKTGDNIAPKETTLISLAKALDVSFVDFVNGI